MKDYKAIEGLQDNIRVEVKAAYDKGYKQGFNDGEGSYLVSKKKEAEAIEAYQKGLDYAWEICGKIIEDEWWKASSYCQVVFGTDNPFSMPASEALRKIREYEEKQNAEIKVGDEVMCGQHQTIKMVVVDTSRGIKATNGYDSWYGEKGSCHKTGRHFPEIEQVLKAMKE